MKIALVTLFTIFAVCMGNFYERSLLDTLKQLNLNNFLNTLAVDQQLLLVDMVAHGDAGTLTKFVNDVGYAKFLEIFIALTADDETTIKKYMMTHLANEAAGPINAHQGVATGHGN